MEVKVNSCVNCPFKQHHSGHGENWYHCTHPKSPDAYDSILCGGREQPRITPEWCPLKKEKYTIEFQGVKNE